MLKEEFEELIKREVNENQYKNIETAYEALPEYMDKMYLASAISNDIGKAINVLSFLGSYISELMGSIIIERQAPHHICTGEICDNCKKIIDDGGCFIIEVEDGSDQKNPYRTGRYCAIKKEAAKKILGQEHSVVYMEKFAYSQIIP